MDIQLLKKVFKQGRVALASISVSVLLIACGSSNTEIVAFGDSLTDGGTYKNGLSNGPGSATVASLGGGKFTTNGANAKTWAEVVATAYGDDLTPAAAEGLGQSLTHLSGKNYAQGGSMVKSEHPEGRNQATVGFFNASKTPVEVQINRYLEKYGSFNKDQIVLVSAGANDVFVATDSTLATNPNPMVPILQAADDLALLVKRIQDNGATKIGVANLPNMGKTPAAGSNAATLTNISTAYNARLKAKLDAAGVKYVWIDSFAWINDVLADPSVKGITSTTVPACSTAVAGGNSLFCSAATLVMANADKFYAFADSVHPTTKMHQLYGEYAYGVLTAAGY